MLRTGGRVVPCAMVFITVAPVYELGGTVTFTGMVNVLVPVTVTV